MQKTRKIAKHVLLSSITASLLFSPLMALPSGGKFTHGTSGSISVNGNTMNIHGNKVSSVIQWGGGFNINHGETVNFNGSNKNYLNIAQGTNKSTIAGLLNASGNNVFLINPNGVIITKTGVINANRFVASTSSMDTKELSSFANMKNFSDGLTFSPVFKPNKQGEVVNMGNLNANNILLIGNKIDVQGQIGSTSDSKTHLVGNDIYLGLNAEFKAPSADITAKNVYTQNKMIDFANDNYKIAKNKVELNGVEYKGIKNTADLENLKAIITIGNMGSESANFTEWLYFVDGWNGNKGNTREVVEFRLVDNIDFGGRNLADKASLNGVTANDVMIRTFNKVFDGQGYTLKNMQISINSKNFKDRAGIFASTSKGAILKNINLDFNNKNISASLGSDNAKSSYVGGLVGGAYGTTFENIILNNIGTIKGEDVVYAGGLVGYTSGSTFNNIAINNINSIISGSRYYSSSAGGLIGTTEKSNFSNIAINNIGTISAGVNGRSGGFAGVASENSTLDNITINSIRSVDSSNTSGFAGGFAGSTHTATFSNITINNINRLWGYGGQVGGFAGRTTKSTYDKIAINNINELTARKYSGYGSEVGGFASHDGGNNNFSNIILYNIGGRGMFTDQSYLSGFLGSQFGENGNTFTNIHVHYNPNATYRDTAGKKFSPFSSAGGSRNQVYVYANPDLQKSFYGNYQYYTHSNTSDEYFSKRVESLEVSKDDKGNYIFSSVTIPDFTSSNLGSNSVKLEKDDVISKEDLNAILNDILNGRYFVDIADKNFKISGVTDSVMQSMSFLEALYGQEGMKELLEGFDLQYSLVYDKFQKIKSDEHVLKAFINTDLKNLVNESEDLFAQLQATQKELENLAKQYNDRVKEINENLKNENDLILNALKTQIDALDNQSKELFAAINEKQAKLESWQKQASEQSKEAFTVKGKLNNVQALYNPKLDVVGADNSQNNGNNG
ncbi:filamentous hemagglutinin N-terminal domain-containing protein, partial [Campylobacter volucris]|uniref:two-partner secretion domain-containing protein n=1 Tax=Campylobacter volucris TaxID=1031542 RepID=UPI00189EC4E9